MPQPVRDRFRGVRSPSPCSFLSPICPQRPAITLTEAPGKEIGGSTDIRAQQHGYPATRSTQEDGPLPWQEEWSKEGRTTRPLLCVALQAALNGPHGDLGARSQPEFVADVPG